MPDFILSERSLPNEQTLESIRERVPYQAVQKQSYNKICGFSQGKWNIRYISKKKDRLDALGMDYKRADHAHADTMEDCMAIEKVLGAKICKNLFLCNRQKTSFYMLLMPGDKPFKTKFLTSQLNCARLSFAEADKMQEYLHTIPGSVSALELIFDTDNNIQLVIDNDLMKDEYICGHPGINTSTVCLLRDDMLRYVREAKHEPAFIDLPVE